MIPDAHLAVVKKIVASLADQLEVWVVTGSASWALQGVPVEVHDIDLQTDYAGAYAIERLLAEFSEQPVRFREAERIRSHLGRMRIGGIVVEVMGALQKRREDGTWEEPVPVERYRQWVDVDGVRVPVMNLEYEYQAYLRLGRRERAQRLREWLDYRSLEIR